MKTSLFPSAFADRPAGANHGYAKRFRYRLVFQRVADGKLLDAGFADPFWLETLKEQAIFQAQRRGVVGADPTQANVSEQALFVENGDGQLKAIAIAAGERESSHVTHFELNSAFSAPAETALKKLLENKQLTTEDKVTFKVFAEPMAEVAEQPASQNPGVRAMVKRHPLPLLNGWLSDYLSAAKLCGEMEEKDHPLFLPRKLFEQAREYCFKTGRQEGGAMMVARMYRQTEPEPDIFAVVHAVVELRHAKQSQFGFEPTPETFADLNTQLNLRRTRLGFPEEMPAVLVHNHPFEPSVRDDGEANCPTCPLQKECQLTSSFYSASDVNFHLSLYGTQPFVAGIVIGLTPRREDDVRMFILEGTKTRERGFYWIE